MANTFTLSLIRLAQRLFILLMLSCCAYVIVFFFSKDQDSLIPENNKIVSKKGIALMSPSPVFDLQPYDVSAISQARDIFSLTSTVSSSGAVENTPKGQLPDHLKVVGILIDHPSQIIIEDTSSNTTYFIDEGHPQDGIKMVKVGPDQMTINYQGQNIIVPVTKG